MAVLPGIEDDFAIVDGVEAVSFTPQNPSADAIPSVQAHRGAPTQEELQFSPAGMERRTVAWILWDSALGSTVPRNGDKVTDSSSVAWTIFHTQDMRTGAYRCLAYEES